MKARFRVQVDGSDDEQNWSGSGFDQVQYLIATNPGEPLKPVEQIASGGEMSRVMLALKATIEARTRRRSWGRDSPNSTTRRNFSLNSPIRSRRAS